MHILIFFNLEVHRYLTRNWTKEQILEIFLNDFQDLIQKTLFGSLRCDKELNTNKIV